MIDALSFDYLCKYFKDKIGLVLGKEKGYLIETRLLSLLEKYKLKNFSELVAEIKTEGNKGLMHDVLTEMTTNESLFFRDTKPFDYFKRKMLPEAIERNKDSKTVMIWSVAASTGQEPYSLSMIINEEFFQYKDWKFKIIGTDFSKKALERAQKGLYSNLEIKRGLDDYYLKKYFTQKDKNWFINEPIIKSVEYRHLNILDDYGYMETFDIIFCRNILIYFDVELKKTVIANLSKHLKPSGYFVLGSAETMIGLSDIYENIEEPISIYRKK